jgi:hypothetical protein
VLRGRPLEKKAAKYIQESHGESVCSHGESFDYYTRNINNHGEGLTLTLQR